MVGPSGRLLWSRPMVCPECGEPVIPLPPTFWTPANGPAPGWSHQDGEPLCRVMTPRGYAPADPVPATVHTDSMPSVSAIAQNDRTQSGSATAGPR